MKRFIWKGETFGLGKERKKDPHGLYWMLYGTIERRFSAAEIRSMAELNGRQ
jgi:hypothetical protein